MKANPAANNSFNSNLIEGVHFANLLTSVSNLNFPDLIKNAEILTLEGKLEIVFIGLY
jgi:hypothetical protein